MFERDSDQQLTLRLRRIAAAIGSLGKTGERRRLLAMENELLSVRAALARRCEKLTDEMRASRAQLGAIAAYARCASVTRDALKNSAAGKAAGKTACKTTGDLT